MMDSCIHTYISFLNLLKPPNTYIRTTYTLYFGTCLKKWDFSTRLIIPLLIKRNYCKVSGTPTTYTLCTELRTNRKLASVPCSWCVSHIKDSGVGPHSLLTHTLSLFYSSLLPPYSIRKYAIVDTHHTMIYITHIYTHSLPTQYLYFHTIRR